MKPILLRACALVIPIAAWFNVTVAATPSPQQQKPSKIQIALLLDTSGSMDGLINQARAQLWKIVELLSQATKNNTPAKFELALYEYGNDGLAKNDGWIRMITPFTNDLDAVSEKLFELSTNGGTELCPTVVKVSAEQLKWGIDPGDFRMIVIAGNEEYQQGDIMSKVACEAARKRDISLTTIYCGNNTDGVAKQWLAASICGGGGHASINTVQDVVYRSTPFDAELQTLNTQLNDTYVGYGANGVAMKTRQVNEDRKAMGVHAEVLAKRSKVKSTKAYDNTSWDIVDKYDSDSTAVIQMAPAALPVELRSKSKDEVVTHVKQLKGKRLAVQTKIDDVSKKRDLFLAEQKKLNALAAKQASQATLDDALLKTIRDLASRKNFAFN